MNKQNELIYLVDKLVKNNTLESDEYENLIANQNEKITEYAAKHAVDIRKKIYGNDVYIRGLIEVGNVCYNDCFYCGIRRSNRACERYTLNNQQILKCCEEGYKLGFRTFVLQGGEGSLSVGAVCEVVSKIRKLYPDCAITLSLGEYSREDYRRMYESGANRYLLRHETADRDHYEKLHPKSMSFDNRLICLYDLKEIGFQVGCGFMVGSPYQTSKTLAKDLKFIEKFRPDMCGIGPFIPQKNTQFRNFSAGSVTKTLFLLSLIRLIEPNILLPATTALGTIQKGGREKGILSGANVVMPNLSPVEMRKKYTLYDNKLSDGAESAQSLNLLRKSMKEIGYNIVTDRGDIKNIKLEMDRKEKL